MMLKDAVGEEEWHGAEVDCKLHRIRCAQLPGDMRPSAMSDGTTGKYGTLLSEKFVYEILQPLSTGFVDEYVSVTPSQVRRLRAPVLYKRPIEERVTLPPAPEVVYVPVPIPRNQKKGRGSRGRGLQQNHGQRNNVRGVINRGYFKGRPNSGRGGHVGNGRRGGKTVPTGHYPPLAKKSVSQLDRELEEYMKKSKHPKIII
uniref:FoP_duplication domain-containing protein n=1 Tax=Angiostrongylus cantonensis TaxID=6313 RepID=A0A158PCL9_ANGCA